jgi:hypothetical protein
MGWIDKTHSDITTNDKDINNQLTPELVIQTYRQTIKCGIKTSIQCFITR